MLKYGHDIITITSGRLIQTRNYTVLYWSLYSFIVFIDNIPVLLYTVHARVCGHIPLFVERVFGLIINNNYTPTSD